MTTGNPALGSIDNPKLSANRRRRPQATDAPGRLFSADTDSLELAGAIGRIMRSLVRRATSGDLDAVTELWAIERAATIALVDAARGAHDGPGAYSWSEIAAELDVTRQAARQRFNKEVRHGPLAGDTQSPAERKRAETMESNR